MKYLMTWIIVFLIVFLFYFFFVILRKDKVKQFKNNSFLRYLVRVYHLDKKKLNLKKMTILIALCNSFIIATTFSIVILLDNFLMQMFLALGLLILLQILIYHIIGTILKRSDKNV